VCGTAAAMGTLGTTLIDGLAEIVSSKLIDQKSKIRNFLTIFVQTDKTENK
jgi:hypothetical protein